MSLPQGIAQTPENHLSGDRQRIDRDFTVVAKADLENMMDLQEAILRQLVHDEPARLDGLLVKRGNAFVNYITRTVAGLAWLCEIKDGEAATTAEVDQFIVTRGRDAPTRVKDNWKRSLQELGVTNEEMDGFFPGSEINEVSEV